MSLSSLNDSDFRRSIFGPDGFSDKQMAELLMSVELEAGAVVSAADNSVLMGLGEANAELAIRWLSSVGESHGVTLRDMVLFGRTKVPAEVMVYLLSAHPPTWKEAADGCTNRSLDVDVRVKLTQFALSRPLAFKKYVQDWYSFADPQLAPLVVHLVPLHFLSALVPYVTDTDVVVRRLVSGTAYQSGLSVLLQHHRLTAKQKAALLRSYRRRRDVGDTHAARVMQLFRMRLDGTSLDGYFASAKNTPSIGMPLVLAAVHKDDIVSVATKLADGGFESNIDAPVPAFWVASLLQQSLANNFLTIVGEEVQLVVREQLERWAVSASAAEILAAKKKMGTHYGASALSAGSFASARLFKSTDALELSNEDVAMLLSVATAGLTSKVLAELVQNHSEILLRVPVPALTAAKFNMWMLNKLAILRIQQTGGTQALIPALKLLPTWQHSLQELVDVCIAARI